MLSFLTLVQCCMPSCRTPITKSLRSAVKSPGSIRLSTNRKRRSLTKRSQRKPTRLRLLRRGTSQVAVLHVCLHVTWLTEVPHSGPTTTALTVDRAASSAAWCRSSIDISCTGSAAWSAAIYRLWCDYRVWAIRSPTAVHAGNVWHATDESLWWISAATTTTATATVVVPIWLLDSWDSINVVRIKFGACIRADRSVRDAADLAVRTVYSATWFGIRLWCIIDSANEPVRFISNSSAAVVSLWRRSAGLDRHNVVVRYINASARHDLDHAVPVRRHEMTFINETMFGIYQPISERSPNKGIVAG